MAGALILSGCNFQANPAIIAASHDPIAPSQITSTAPPTNLPGVLLTPTATMTPACAESQGQILQQVMNSTVAGGAVPYRVYLPPCYSQTNRRYPYVILLHGAGDDESEWTDELGVNQVLDQGVAAGTLPPMILVMPYGGELEYTNDFSTDQTFETYIITELMPLIETDFCAQNRQAGRALAGISRGGFWVFEIGLRHPDLFTALAGHSAYLDPTNADPAYNPLDLIQHTAYNPAIMPRFWLDVAADDPDTQQGLDSFSQYLTARGITPDYTVYPTGGHTVEYWQSHLFEYLSFYGKTWPHNPLDLPLCAG